MLIAQRSPAQTNDLAKSASELKNMSLQQLFDMEVTSVSKKTRKALRDRGGSLCGHRRG